MGAAGAKEAPLFRRRDRRANRPYGAASNTTSGSCGGGRRRSHCPGGGAAAPLRATRDQGRPRALASQRRAHKDDREPAPRRGARQDARTIQEGSSPRGQSARRATKHDSASGVRGRRRAVAPWRSRRPRRTTRVPRNARDVRRGPRGQYAAERAGSASRDARAVRHWNPRAVRRETRGQYAIGTRGQCVARRAGSTPTKPAGSASQGKGSVVRGPRRAAGAEES